MAKVCLCGCGNPVFSNRYAKYCQYKRTDDKWIRAQEKKAEKIKSKPKTINRHYIKSITPKPYSGINDLNVTKEVEMYDKIWEEREPVSFLSGRSLGVSKGSNFWFNIFAHVLAKGKAKYPKFKLYSKNLILLTPEEHNLLDFCSKADREAYAKRNNCDWKIVYDLMEELKKEYKELYG